MTREEVRKELLEINKNHSNILCELPTGYGKTRMALEMLKHSNTCRLKVRQVLIVIPRNVLIDSWKAEIKKWKMDLKNIEYTFTTYVSFPKERNIQTWDAVIFDEAHHISDRCIEAIPKMFIYKSILLSATVKSIQIDKLKTVFSDLYCYKINMKEAIDNDVLPDPKVFLIPLTLKNDEPTESIWKNTKSKNSRIIECSWATRWQYIKQKEYKVRIYCTEAQYMYDLDAQIDWFKKKYLRTRNNIFKNKWLRLCGDRLKYLAEKKNPFIITLLDKLKNERTLTFCNNIEQTEKLGKYCINSKNEDSRDNLENFNSGKIKHITACNMLNEGANLVNCRVGIYGNLNSSEIIIKQRLGRILRHKEPVIIIPYYKGTREEELVNQMIEDYNPELIQRVNFISEIKL